MKIIINAEQVNVICKGDNETEIIINKAEYNQGIPDTLEPEELRPRKLNKFDKGKTLGSRDLSIDINKYKK